MLGPKHPHHVTVACIGITAVDLDLDGGRIDEDLALSRSKPRIPCNVVVAIGINISIRWVQLAAPRRRLFTREDQPDLASVPRKWFGSTYRLSTISMTTTSSARRAMS